MPPVLVPAVTVRAAHGMVAAADHLGTQAGISVLDAGGGAADAAIAANAVLTVTAPHLCGLGGDLFALVAHDGDAPEALDASGRAGSGADPECLRAEGHTRMPFRHDVRAATVPGCVDGWLALHARHGRLPLEEVLAPAVRVADEGFAASPHLAATAPQLRGVRGAEDLAGRAPYQPGTVLRRPGVAEVLRRIGTEGRAGFYAGPVGEALLAAGDGEYAAEDLAEEQASWVSPLSAPAWGRTLWTVPPASQGYLVLAAATVAHELGLPEDPDDPAFAHVLADVARAVAVDRVEVLHEDAAGDELLSPVRLDRARTRFDPRAAARLPSGAGDGDTTAICAADRDGLGVSLIQSNASGFGCHVAIGDTGVLLHNRGIGFSLEPGHPAEYGPRRRPPHTLSPVVATDAAGSWSQLLATMGGDGQPQFLVQVLAGLAAGRAPASAVAAGRWRWTSSSEEGFDTWVDPAGVVLEVEGHAPASWVPGLRSLGHDARSAPAHDSRFGHVQLISREGGVLLGASDHRARVGAALGR